VKFEWDESKNASNIEKHGLDFADGKEMFQAPMLTKLDTRFDYNEDRYVGIGFVKNIVVVVVFTEPARDTVRFISLRKAVKHERNEYEQALKNRLG